MNQKIRMNDLLERPKRNEFMRKSNRIVHDSSYIYIWTSPPKIYESRGEDKMSTWEHYQKWCSLAVNRSSKLTFHTLQIVCISKLSSIRYWSHTFNVLLQNLELPFRKLYFYHHLLTLRLLPKIEMRNNTCKRSICLRNFDV